MQPGEGDLSFEVETRAGRLAPGERPNRRRPGEGDFFYSAVYLASCSFFACNPPTCVYVSL